MDFGSFYKLHPATPASQMMAELAWASWETMAYRTLMMARGACSSTEYRRMFDEKAAAVQETGELLLLPGGASAEALLTPWHIRATANAKRLRGR